MKLRLLGACAAVLAVPLAAHDFWLQPLRFQGAVNAPFPLTFQLGHGPFKQRWGAESKILYLYDIFNGRRDLRGDVRSMPSSDLVTRFPAAGLHVIALQSSYALSDLPAIRFNDYAKAEGLGLVLASRQRTGTTNSNGRERYSRRAKALVQIGPQTAATQGLATRAIGLKLEIVPERNPYALGPSRSLPVHVLYQGRRLPNATIMLTSLEFDARPLSTLVTDRAGRATFQVPAVGEWLLNVVWSEPVRGDPNADFDTTFSSLTFGYDPSRRAG